MIVVVCSNASCGAAFRVMGDPVEVNHLVGASSSFWPNRYTCPSCEAAATGVLESDIDVRTLPSLRDLEAQELFQALNGMGLPEEQDCTIESVTKVLLDQRIVKVIGHSIEGTRRYCLEHVEFDDGRRLYFAAGSHGATAYRLTLPIKHTEKVLEEFDEPA